MSGGIEAVGDIATGALVAGAVEPHAGKESEHAHGKCLNCGAMLLGPYCHGCGQNSHIHRTIAGFGHDLLHGVFHFEGKLWNTLPLLFLKPGELTRRYIHGERARFVSPLAAFLFCTFLMFAVVGGLAGSMYVDSTDVGGVHLNVINTPEQLKKKIAEIDAKSQALKTRIKAEDKAGHDTGSLEKELDDLDETAAALHKAEAYIPGAAAAGSGGGAMGRINTGWPALDHGIRSARENPNLFLYKLQSSAYKYSWALIPISTPLVWLLFFWRRQYRAYDHLVFVTFSITFMMLLVTALVAARAVGLPNKWVALAAVLIPPLHMYRQLRGAYLCSRFGALARTAVLLVMSLLALTLYLVLLLVMGVFH